MFCINAIPCFSWSNPAAQPRALMMCIHGLGLHGGVFKTFGEHMASLGIRTFSIDVRGFGNWNREALSMLDFETCISDIHAQIQELRATYPGLPVFVLGESMGGAIATRFVSEWEELVDGLIVCAPVHTISEHKREIPRILIKAVLQPHQPIELPAWIIERAPLAVAAENDRDPQVRLHFSVQELLHLSRFFCGISKHARNIKRIPVLVIQGHRDRVVTSRSSLKFFDRLATQKKQLVVFGSAEHLLFQTSQIHAKAIGILHDWLQELITDEEPLLRLVG